MTDLERLKSVFEAIGIEYKVEARGERVSILITGAGYSDFYHAFDFDLSGKLVAHGGYE